MMSEYKHCYNEYKHNYTEIKQKATILKLTHRAGCQLPAQLPPLPALFPLPVLRLPPWPGSPASKSGTAAGGDVFIS